MTRTFSQVSALFDCLSEGEIHERLVWDENVHRFSAAVSALRQGVGDDDLLRPMLWKLNRLRFDLMAAPVSPQAAGVEIVHDQLAQDRVRIEAALPRLQNVITETISAIEALSQREVNPLLDALFAAFACQQKQEAQAPVVLAESRLIEPAQKAAAGTGLDAVQWMTPHELRLANRMEQLIVLGAPRWFPDHVFTAPRSPEIHAIRYRWVTADWERLRSPTFAVARSDKQAMGQRRLVISRDRSPTPVSVVHAEESDLLPQLDLDDWMNERAGGGGPDREWSGDDEVDAAVIRLEGDDFVLLEDGHKTWIVDLDQDDPVCDVPVGEITPGVFVLLRTEGGGDYVVDVADRVLGSRARPARETQRLWKSRLREVVRSRGADVVIDELRRRGSQIASDSNLRNWLSPRNIRTRDRVEFDAILAVIGLDLDSERDEMWKQMTLIDRAHRRAGRVIRNQLMAKVRQTDPQEILRHGRLDFEMEEGGGALTALRVVEVAPCRRKVPRNQLDRVLSAIEPESLL